MSVERSGQPDYSTTVLGPRVVPATYERRTIVLNDSEITTGAPPANRSADAYGKFFPRGMRGTLEEIRLYALGDGVDTVEVKISPQPGLGATYSTTITPPAAWGWVAAAFNVMWNYDSMYVWVDDCEAAVFWGYDEVKPHDTHRTVDAGTTFTDVDERLFARAVMTGETAGDVPVSGTVNVIEVPSIAGQIIAGSVDDVATDTWTSIASAEGAGTMVEAVVQFHTAVAPTKGAAPAAVVYTVEVRADFLNAGYAGNRDLTQSETAPLGRCSKGEFFQTYAEPLTAGDTWIYFRAPIKFRRSLSIRAYHSSGAAVTIGCYAHANQIK